MIEALVGILQSATPLVYVTLGCVLAARAGIWNLGLEGLMIGAACAAVVGTKQTSSLGMGLALAIGVCIFGSALLWFVIEKLRANPIIAGLGLSGLGLGGSDLAIQALYGSEGSVQSPLSLPHLGAGAGDFAGCSYLVIAMPFCVLAVWLVIRRTRFGLQLTACGEHPFAARSVGVDPVRVRLIALVAGGVLCALGGTELALGNLHVFSIGMTAGRGYMAFAATTFGMMNPFGSALAAAFFAVVEYLGIKAQFAFGTKAPPELILSLPYLATVAGVWLSSRFNGGVATTSELREY